MKLTELYIQNYRSLVDVKLPLRDLAVMIGPNGAGETALLEIFRLLQKGLTVNLATLLRHKVVFNRS